MLWPETGFTKGRLVACYREVAPDHPRALVFDLDPGPPPTILDCCRVALQLRAHFEAVGCGRW